MLVSCLKRIVYLCLFVGSVPVMAQSVVVPSKVEFAGMKLTLNAAARKKVQEDVDRLRRNPKFFQAYVDKADLYFPIIEQVFREENFPEDVKYLIIQESAFKADAVSSSQAVGYWQFKKGTAQEVGLRVDGAIDERKNIVSASRGAAKYIKQNNVKLDNWVYALTAYNTGLGGVQRYVDKKYIGADKMEITGNTHWYFLKFLAHKIAFEDAVGKQKPERGLSMLQAVAGASLKSISKDANVDLEELSSYNMWIDPNKKIPSDKTYVVVIPGELVGGLVAMKSISTDKVENSNKTEKVKPVKIQTKVKPKTEPKVEDISDYDPENPPIFLIVNGLRAIKAREGDELLRLSVYSGIDREKFLRYNEIKNFHQPIEGQHYFITKKKSKGLVNYHTVQRGESLWYIAQKYGMRMKKILSYNRMSDTEALEEGRVLWLRRKRPSDQPVKYERIEPIEGNDKSNTLVEENEPDNYEGPKIHLVEKGQTLYSISKIYKVSVEEIRDWNNKTDNNVSIGEKLIIKN